jgi:hypothetical protein
MAGNCQRSGGTARFSPAGRGRADRRYALALAAVTVAAGLLRAVRLGHPMRYDEAFTFLRFAASPDPAVWFAYETPNNHLLHTLLVRLATWLAGPWPAAIRTPAFLAGAALVPVGGHLARRIAGRPLAGLIAAVLIGASSLVIEYSANARGYSLVCLAGLVLAHCAWRICRDGRTWTPWVGFALVSAIGMFAIPVMAYPIAILSVVVLLQRVVRRGGSLPRRLVVGRLAASLAAAAALTLLLYAPTLHVSGFGAVFANRFIAPRPLGEVARELPGAVAATARDWTRDTGAAWIALVAIGLAACVIVGVRRRRMLWLAPAIAPVVLLALALAQRVVPLPRVWLFLLPLLLVLSACGLSRLAEALPPGSRPWLAPLAVGVIVAAASAEAAVRHARRRYLVSEEPRTLVDADAIMRDTAELYDGHTALLSEVPSWPSLSFYALFHLKPHQRMCDYSDLRCRRAVIVVAPRQSLASVLAANGGAAEGYGPPTLHKRYPRAEVYLAPRRRR